VRETRKVKKEKENTWLKKKVIMDVRIDVIKKKTWRKSGESGRSSVGKKKWKLWCWWYMCENCMNLVSSVILDIIWKELDYVIKFDLNIKILGIIVLEWIVSEDA
jgi:hypothetical protein